MAQLATLHDLESLKFSMSYLYLKVEMQSVYKKKKKKRLSKSSLNGSFVGKGFFLNI